MLFPIDSRKKADLVTADRGRIHGDISTLFSGLWVAFLHLRSWHSSNGSRSVVQVV